MTRRFMGGLGSGLAVAALALLLTTVDAVQAQASDNRVVIAPRGGMLSFVGGSGGYLGVRIGEVDSDEAAEAGVSASHGVYVSSVSDDSPAMDAGIEDGDVILGWNGVRIEGVAQLQRLVRETPTGRTVDLTVLRGGAEREVSAELRERSSARTFSMPGGDRIELRRDRNMPRLNRNIPRLSRPQGRGELRSFFFSNRPRLGASIQSLGDQLADYFGVESGALVTSVNEDSPAAAAGLMAGDVIVELAGETVEGPGDLLEVLGDQDPGSVEMRIYRDGSSRSLTVELEERDSNGDGDGDGVRASWRRGDQGGGWEIGPIDFDGFEVGPIQWRFGFDGSEGIEIPGFEMRGFEMPDFEIPGLELPSFGRQNVQVDVSI